MAQQVKAWIIQLICRNAQHFRAKISTQRPLIEHKPDIKGRGQRRFNLIQFGFAKPMSNQTCMVDRWCVTDAAMTHRI